MFYTTEASEDGLSLTFKPESLVINLGEPFGTVTIDVEAVSGAKYVTASEKMTFSIIAKNVKVGGANLTDFKPITLSFDAKKIIY